MTTPIKVYGYRGGCGGSGRIRMIVAVRSRAAAARALGINSYEADTYGDWTGNFVEVDQAMSDVGVVFWRGLDDRTGDWERGLP